MQTGGLLCNCRGQLFVSLSGLHTNLIVLCQRCYPKNCNGGESRGVGGPEGLTQSSVPCHHIISAQVQSLLAISAALDNEIVKCTATRAALRADRLVRLVGSRLRIGDSGLRSGWRDIPGNRKSFTVLFLMQTRSAGPGDLVRIFPTKVSAPSKYEKLETRTLGLSFAIGLPIWVVKDLTAYGVLECSLIVR